MSANLAVSLTLATPTGVIELEDPAGGYSLHKDTYTQAAHTFRKQEITSEWTEGTFYGRAVEDNVTETVAVWVNGTSQFDFQAKVEAVLAGFRQLQYQMVKTIGDARWTWQCFVADFSIETSQEFLFATTGLIRAQVPRLPHPAVVQVP